MLCCQRRCKSSAIVAHLYVFGGLGWIMVFEEINSRTDVQMIQYFGNLLLPLFNYLQQGLALLDVGIKLIDLGLGLVLGGPKPLHLLLHLLQLLLCLPQSIASGIELGRATLFNLSDLSIQAIADRIPARCLNSRQIGTLTLFFRGQLLFDANFLAELFQLVETTFVLYSSQ